MTPAIRQCILDDVNSAVAASDPVTGPDYPRIFRDVAVMNGVSLKDVHRVVRDDAAGMVRAG